MHGSPQSTAIQDDPQARALLQGASAQSYKLPRGFTGFTARVVAQMEDQQSQGDVTIYTPRHVQVRLLDSTTQLWVERELQSMIGHRWPTPFEERDGRYVLTMDTTPHPLGTRIDLHGDPLQSYYRVHDRHITQVYRVIGEQCFTIQIIATHSLPDGRYVPTHFTVVFRDHRTQRIISSSTYSDQYTSVGNCWLPRSRRVLSNDSDGNHAYELHLSNHRLLDASPEVGIARQV